MKKNYLFLFLLLCSFLGYAQRKESHVCGSDELHIHMSKDKVYQAKTEKINSFWRKTGGEIKPKSGGMETNSIPSSPITLQVVFHDMNTGVSTLDYANIVAKLNTIYSGGILSPMIANGSTLPNKPGMADTQIRFCLALQDINGNTYTAAESQHYTAVSSLNPSNEQAINAIVNNSQSSTGFPTTKYINIYIVNNISGNTAGFATMPYAHGTLIDGIYIERAYLTPNGPDGTNLNYNMNVLAHEMGHFLGLFHTFGICSPDTINDLTENGYNACSCNNDDCLFNGDMVCDTPPNMLIDSGYTCGTPPNSCNTDNMPTGPLDVADDKGNYMDYGNYYCQNHFSTGQVERMHFMIDPVSGPRKSLIVTSCTNCNSLDNCSFTINTNITNNQTVQGSSINFSAVSAPGCGLSGSGLTYTWSLLMAGNTTPVTATGVNYSPAGLTAGNYVLTLRAANTSNSQCFELTTYNFKVIPIAGTCLLSLPANNSNWGTWDRVTYKNGWSRNLQSPPSYPYTYPNTIRTEVPAGPDAGQNFDVFPATSFNDPNFAGISVPSGVTRIMRVGPKLGTGNPISPGNGSYVSVTFHPTANNCKFRIHTLGLREATPNQYIAYSYGINHANNSTAAFGYVCQYLFDSPVSTGTGQNTRIGMSENGYLIPDPTPGNFIIGSTLYGLNDMVSEQHNNSSSNFITVGTQRRMNQWTSQVLDFSEFVNLNTDITITFFAHTNDAVDALYSAYSYFGIECLGGGLPDDITMDLPDVSLSCAYQKEESCIEIPLPRPAYATDNWENGAGLSWLNLSNNLAKVNLSKLEGGVYVPVPNVQVLSENIGGFMEYSIRICLDDNDAPFEDYRVELITLNKTLTDDFRIFKGFFYNDPPCLDTNIFGGTVPEGVQQNRVWCPGSALQPLTLTDPCFPGNYQYQWFVKDDGYAIPGATGASLQPAEYQPFMVHCKRSFVRKVLFTDPYCGAESWLEGETYTVFNLGGITYSTYNITKNDVCLYSNNTAVNITFTLVTDSSCIGFAPPPGLPSSNSVTAQLTYNNQPVGAPLVLNYVGNPPFFLFQNQLLSFNNNTVNGPILGVGSHSLTLKITASNYGCTSTYNISGFVTINVKESPEGGKIQLDHECVIIDINSNDHGVTNEDLGYAWEYSQNVNGPFLPIPGASNLATLSGLNLTSYSLPLYIRRKSFGFDTCPDDVYSNVIQVNAPQTVPTFNFPLTICSGQPAPSLPLISDNGIAGTWSPSTMSNTVSQTYTFTPNSNQCTNKTTTVTTTIIPMATPFFSVTEDVCTRHIPLTLPTISNNGISGTWNPPVIEASGTYTFTPSDSCNQSVTLNVTVTSDGGTTLPYFTNLQTVYCQGAAANPFPTTSSNGHVGTWNIAAPDTSILGTTTYVFTSNQGACSFTWVPITVVAPGIPTFDINTTICPGDSPSDLPSTSLNGVPGTWSPAYISPVNSGNYTFTPTSSCNPPVTVSVYVLEQCTFQLYWSSDVSCQEAGEGPRQVQDIADGQCVRVCENSTINYFLGGANISSVDWIITGGTIVGQNSNGTEVQITWSQADYCAIQGTIHRTNGTQVTFNKCIEKLSSPRADFMIMPGPGMTGCLDSPVHFRNLTTVNYGNDILYFNWDFGDGHTSNEFEPSHTYTGTGTYTVRLTAFNGCSCTSTQIFDVVISEFNTVPITCEGIVCEGQTSIYSIPAEYSGCDMEWSAVGGEVVWFNSDKTKAEIFWNQVDDSGFGYVSVYSPSCFPCPSTLKVPIVKQHGTITGNVKMCANSQSVYSLPKWPTTEFNWELIDNGTGADLRYNNQRNEVIVNSGSSGEMKLRCTYFNTLLRCGGTAIFNIVVKPKLSLWGATDMCRNVETEYMIKDENSNPVSASWQFTGPNGFSQTGSSSSIHIAFPEEGIYNFEIIDAEYCMELMSVKVLSEPETPEAIDGPLVTCSGVDADYSCNAPDGCTVVWEVENGIIVGSNQGETVRVKFNDTSNPYVVKAAFIKNNCKSEDYSITVQRVLPNLALTINDPEVCGSSYATYKVADDDLQNYIWSIEPETAGSVSEGQNEQQVTILWNQTPQNATLHLDARKCGMPYEADYPVTITGGPTVTINGPATICNGNQATFNLSFSTPTTFTSAIWDFGNGQTATVLGTAANPNSVSFTYDFNSESDLSYTISVKVKGANGCGMDLIDTFDIVVAPSPLAYISPNEINLCGAEEGFVPMLHIVQESLGGTVSIQWYKSGVTGPLSAVGSSIDTGQYGTGWYHAVLTNTVGCSITTGAVRVVEDCDVVEPAECGVEFAPIVDAVVIPSELGGFKLVANIIGLEYGTMPETVEWSITGGVAGGSIGENDNYQYIVHNLNPGLYSLVVKGKSEINGVDCYSWPTKVDFFIPYKPDLYARTNCIGNGLYEVELIDFSDYHALAEIDDWKFAIIYDPNNINWTAPTINSNNLISQTWGLPPGEYIVGIKISGAGHPEVIQSIMIDLPAYPNPQFTFDTACEGEATHFTVTNPQPGWSYLWNFGNGVTNTQQNPAMTFTGNQPFPVSLSVSDGSACGGFASGSVNVNPVNLAGGTLTASPATVCDGSPITLTYTSAPGGTVPSAYHWYKAGVSSPTITNTPTFAVTQGGIYSVEVQDSNGCLNTETPPIIVSFIPSPQPPQISGDGMICLGDTTTLSVQPSNDISYTWYLNGSQLTQWNNAHEIVVTPQSQGTYQYSCIAMSSENGVSCYSQPGFFSVEVFPLPVMPDIQLTSFSCDPYEAIVSVTNPQPDTVYYWSNGQTGTSTIITHDGPIQVRAEINDCTITAQTDLPVDLEAVAWVFPKGCYDACRQADTKEIVGPAGEYTQWSWQENNNNVISGSGQLSSFSGLTGGNNYQLYLNNGYCDMSIGDMSLIAADCKGCQISVNVEAVYSVIVDGVCLYEIKFTMYNPNSGNMWATLTAPDGEGFFMGSTVMIPPGTSYPIVQFFPLNGFTGGNVFVEIESQWEEENCYIKYSIGFPELCVSGRPAGAGADVATIKETTAVNVDMLIVAPNPVSQMATIYYGYAHEGKNKTIEIFDTLGRPLMQYNANNPKGSFQLDCSLYSRGQYLVIMKADDEVIKTTRLIVINK